MFTICSHSVHKFNSIILAVSQLGYVYITNQRLLLYKKRNRTFFVLSLLSCQIDPLRLNKIILSFPLLIIRGRCQLSLDQTASLYFSQFLLRFFLLEASVCKPCLNFSFFIRMIFNQFFSKSHNVSGKFVFDIIRLFFYN